MSNEVQTLQGNALTANPFGNAGASAPVPAAGNAMMTAEVQRSIAEVQAMTMLAFANPRVPAVAMDKILVECQRPSLAEVAVYSFPRGGQNVTGPSIRLAEVIKRNWGHMRSGWRCLERTKGRSLIQAFAYDMQTNVGETREFEVRHIRDTRQGPKPLTDERDIYELEANQAARRVRACILALIDGDVVEAALDQCNRTLEAKADVTAEGVKRMLEAFKPFKVNQAMIEARLGRNVTSITAAQMVGLKNILNGMKDGMSTPAHWFDVNLADKADSADSEKKSDAANAALKDKIKASTGQDKSEGADKAEAKSQEGVFQLIANAKTVDEVDAIWNDNLKAIEDLKDADEKTYAELDKQYLSKRDALAKSEAKSKPSDKPADGKLV